MVLDALGVEFRNRSWNTKRAQERRDGLVARARLASRALALGREANARRGARFDETRSAQARQRANHGDVRHTQQSGKVNHARGADGLVQVGDRLGVVLGGFAGVGGSGALEGGARLGGLGERRGLSRGARGRIAVPAVRGGSFGRAGGGHAWECIGVSYP
jgi:hypothetical protein